MNCLLNFVILRPPIYTFIVSLYGKPQFDLSYLYASTNECDLLRRFFDKNIDIINNGNELKRPGPHIEFKEGGITYPHQNLINELLKIINEKNKSFESSLELLSDYYDKGELFPQEVNAIIHEIHTKKGK